jgi:paraquat-inducible protein A
MKTHGASPYIACHDCDAVFTAPDLEEGEKVLCPRCGANLFTRRRNPLQRATALVGASAILFVLANLFPFLTLRSDYRESFMLLSQSVSGLEQADYPSLASAVGVFIIAAPVLTIGGLLYLLLPLLWDRRLPGALMLCRIVNEARQWNMLEVYLVGVLVSLLKLGSLATLTLGLSFWAYVGLILCLTAALASIDQRELWMRLHAFGNPAPVAGLLTGVGQNSREFPTAAENGLAQCHVCALVEPVANRHCSRCGESLHLRKENSLQRTWALTVAAVLLYLPANLLPVLKVQSSVKGDQQSTILSGVIQFWQEGDYPVATIIFTASIMIPVLKVLSITWLCVAAANGRSPVGSTRLYRVTEFIGRWSMVDVFVVAILVGVVQLGSVMQIEPGPGVLAFAGVVILTMLAAVCFDPRLIWDAAKRRASL